LHRRGGWGWNDILKAGGWSEDGDSNRGMGGDGTKVVSVPLSIART